MYVLGVWGLQFKTTLATVTHGSCYFHQSRLAIGPGTGKEKCTNLSPTTQNCLTLVRPVHHKQQLIRWHGHMTRSRLPLLWAATQIAVFYLKVVITDKKLTNNVGKRRKRDNPFGAVGHQTTALSIYITSYVCDINLFRVSYISITVHSSSTLLIVYIVLL